MCTFFALLYNGFMRITILGSGAWGTALAYALSKKGDNDILLYGNVEAEIDDINTRHQNSKYFPDVTLPLSLKATLDPKLALQA